MTGAVTRQHSSVRRYRELARTPAGNGVDRELLLDGVHLLGEAHAAGILIETAAFEHAALNQPSVRALAEQLAAAGSEVLIVSRNVLEAMSPVKTLRAHSSASDAARSCRWRRPCAQSRRLSCWLTTFRTLETWGR